MPIDPQLDINSEDSSKPWWEILVGMRTPSNIDTPRSQLIRPGEYGVSHWYESSTSDEESSSSPSGQLSAWSQSEYSVSDTWPIKSAIMRGGYQEHPNYAVDTDDDTSTIALSKRASQLTISQDVDENIADILYTPMTGSSSVYSRPEDLPPGVDHAICSYRKGQWSTSEVQLEQLPSPLITALKDSGSDTQEVEIVEKSCDNSFIIGNEKLRELNSSKRTQPWSADIAGDSAATLFSPLSPPKKAREYRIETPETRSIIASLHERSTEKLRVMLEKPLPELPAPRELPRPTLPTRSQTAASCPPPISIPPRVPLRNPYRPSPKSQATKSLLPQPVKSQVPRKRSAQALVLAPKSPPITRPNLEPLSAIGAPSTPRTPKRGLTYEEALMVPWVENDPNRQAPPPVRESQAHQTQDSIASAQSFFSASSPAPPPSIYLCASRASSPTLGLSPPKIHTAPMPAPSMKSYSSLHQQQTYNAPEFEDFGSTWLREKASLDYEPPRRRWLGYGDIVAEPDAGPSSGSYWRKSDKILGLGLLPHSKSMVINRGRPPNMARQRTFPSKSISHIPLRKNGLYYDKEVLPELPLNVPAAKSPLFSPGSEKSPGVSTVSPNSIFSTSGTAGLSSTNTSPSDDAFSLDVHPAFRYKKRTSSMLTIGSFDTNLSQNEPNAGPIAVPAAEPLTESLIPTLYGQRKASDASAGDSSGSKVKEMGFFKKLVLKHRASRDLVRALFVVLDHPLLS